jgi:hypothetical protein
MRVEDDTSRIWAGNATGGKKRIISDDGSNTDNDCINVSTKAVEMFERAGPVDIA